MDFTITSKFDIDQKVKVSDSGCVYPSWQKFADKHKMIGFCSNRRINKNDEFVIFKVALSRHYIVYGIRNKDCHEFIIGEDGLKVG